MNSNNPIPILQAFKLFWKNYVNFKGTSDLGEYWWWKLSNWIIHFIISIPSMFAIPTIISTIANSSSLDYTDSIRDGILSGMSSFGITFVLMIIYSLAVIIPNISLIIRRMRDVGISNGINIGLVVAKYVLSILGLLSTIFFIFSFIVRIVIFVITLLPSNKINNKLTKN